MVTGNKGITGFHGATGLKGITGAKGLFGSVGGGGNPIEKLDNIVNYSQFWNTSSLNLTGSDVDSVDRIRGTINFTNLEASPMEYDATLFDDVGGIKTTDTDSDIVYASDTGGHATTTIAFVLSNIDSAANPYIFSLGTSSFGSASAAIIHGGTGRFRYLRNEASGVETIRDADAKVGTFLFFLEFASASSCKITVIDDDGVEVVTTFDPDDSFISDRVWLGDRGNNNGEAGFGYAEFFQTSDALTETELNNIKRSWDNKFLGGAWSLNNASLFADEDTWILINTNTRLRFK